MVGFVVFSMEEIQDRTSALQIGLHLATEGYTHLSIYDNDDDSVAVFANTDHELTDEEVVSMVSLVTENVEEHEFTLNTGETVAVKSVFATNIEF